MLIIGKKCQRTRNRCPEPGAGCGCDPAAVPGLPDLANIMAIPLAALSLLIVGAAMASGPVVPRPALRYRSYSTLPSGNSPMLESRVVISRSA